MMHTAVGQEAYYNDYYGRNEEQPLVEQTKQAARLSALGRLLGTQRFGRVLVIGCGRGRDVTVPRAKAIVALDLSWAGIRLARREYPVARYLRADGMRLPFPPGIFDAVICSEVIEHVTHPDLLVAEIARVLRSGGCLAMSTPNWVSWWGLCRKLGDLIRLNISYQPVDNWFTPKRLQRLLAGHFVIERWLGVWYLPPTRVGGIGLGDRKLGRLVRLLRPVDRGLGCVLPKMGHMISVLAIPPSGVRRLREPRKLDPWTERQTSTCGASPDPCSVPDTGQSPNGLGA